MRRRVNALNQREQERIKSVSNRHKRTNEPLGKLSYKHAYERFLVRCVNMGLAKMTIRFYETQLRVFEYYVIDCHDELLDDLRLMTSEDIDNFKTYLLEVRESSPANVNIKLKALKTFLRTTELRETVVPYIVFMKDDKYKIKAFTNKDVRKMLNACNRQTYAGYRDFVIIALLIDTGIRLGELINLKTKDLDQQQQTLYIEKSKNGYSRYVPLSKEVTKMINVLIELNSIDCDYIIQSVYAEQIHRQTVYKRLKEVGTIAKVDKNVRVSPHTFRHTFAKFYIQNGGDIFSLQKILGHHSMDIVRVYVNLFDTEVKKAHNLFSPYSNLDKKNRGANQ